MNKEVNNFIDFLVHQLTNAPASLTDEIQNYMVKWNYFDFDTEELEYIVDVKCEVMRMIDVDSDEILF